MSPSQVCYEGRLHRRAELGFNQRSFTLHTGLAEHHRTYFLADPLYEHALVLFGFPHEVSPCPRGSVPNLYFLRK